MIKTHVLPVSAFLISLLFSATVLYSQGNIKSYNEETLNFMSDGKKISGKLITPVKESGKKLPVVVFIHGSGPEDFSSSDNYRYLWEQFTKIGFACYSWDRPGVGDSEGKWYEVGIKQRAGEAIGAVHALESVGKIDKTKIGFWGISQAGWIIPEVAAVISPAFVIDISSPVTTIIEQELYRVEAGMRTDNFSPADINDATTYTKNLKALIDEKQPYSAFAELQDKIEDKKWIDYVVMGNEVVYQYLIIIFKDDKAPDLGRLRCPVLAIWGENDLVVPPKESSAFFRKKMESINNRNAIVKVMPDADHTLTFNTTGKGSDTDKRREAYKQNPAEIFAPGYVELMTNWLKQFVN